MISGITVRRVDQKPDGYLAQASSPEETRAIMGVMQLMDPNLEVVLHNGVYYIVKR